MNRVLWLLLSLVFIENSVAALVPTHVGISQFSTPYTATQSEIKGLVWYPTLAEAEGTQLGPFLLDVTKNAKIKGGSYGLVIISHGSRGSHLGHRDTAAYLAKRGFMVVTLLHPKNNFQDDSAGRTLNNLVNRPRHVSKALDYLLNDWEHRDYINSDAIGVIGHSMGGYTALSLVGGTPNTAYLERHCTQYKIDTAFCGDKGNPVWHADNSQVIADTHDPRIKSAVLLAPLTVPFGSKQALENVAAPILMYRAEKDAILRFPYHVEAVNNYLPIKPTYRIVENAGHFSFLAPFPERIKVEVGEVAHDPEGFDRTKFHMVLNKDIYEFLLWSLR